MYHFLNYTLDFLQFIIQVNQKQHNARMKQLSGVLGKHLLGAFKSLLFGEFCIVVLEISVVFWFCDVIEHLVDQEYVH